MKPLPILSSRLPMDCIERLTLVIAVLTAETMTTSSDELMSRRARPREGREEVILWMVEVIVIASRGFRWLGL